MWVFVLVIVALLQGGWMVFDGVHVLRTGKYFGPDIPGPWRYFPQALGIDPFSMGPAFVVLGGAWLLLGVAILIGKTVLWPLTALAVLSLWYLPLGSVLSIVTLGLLWGGLVP